MDFPRGTNYAHLPEALERGLVKPEVLERAVKNVLRENPDLCDEIEGKIMSQLKQGGQTGQEA